MLKIELHAHTSDDPNDYIPHSSTALIDRAAALGYQALAITLHDRQLDVEPLRAYAAARGIVLIPGIERSIGGKHVLLINFSSRAQQVGSFDDIAELKRLERGLVVVPHPFFPGQSCLGAAIDRHVGVVDAVELNGTYAPGVNFNRAASRWAARHGKPMVGNGDVHRLSQLGTTYSLVDADADPQSICDAIRAGRVEVHSRPLTWPHVLGVLAAIFAADLWTSMQRARARRAEAVQ